MGLSVARDRNPPQSSFKKNVTVEFRGIYFSHGWVQVLRATANLGLFLFIPELCIGLIQGRLFAEVEGTASSSLGADFTSSAKPGQTASFPLVLVQVPRSSVGSVRSHAPL